MYLYYSKWGNTYSTTTISVILIVLFMFLISTNSENFLIYTTLVSLTFGTLSYLPHWLNWNFSGYESKNNWADITTLYEGLDTLEPGILRFGVMGRSEVDRHVGLFGDTILILDGFQVQDLMPSIFLNETSDIDRIRVTVHELQGSHLVWGGWVITILATGLAFLSSERSQLEEE